MRGLTGMLLTIAACSTYGDAPVDTTLAPPLDGGVDASVVVAVEAGADTGATNPAFCAGMTGALLCEDFEGATYATGWTVLPRGKYMTLEAASHAGRVAISSMDWPADGNANDFLLRTTPAVLGHTYRIAFKLWVDELPATQGIEIAKLQVKTYLVHLNLLGLGLVVGEYDIGNAKIVGTDQALGPLVLQQWHSVALEVTLNAGNNLSNLFAASLDTHALSAQKWSNHAGEKFASIDADVGLTYTSTFDGPARYLVDDIVITDLMDVAK